MHPIATDVSNPFLCDDCQQLGYCRKTREASIEDLLAKHYQVLSTPQPEYHFMKDADIANLVPVKTMVKDYFSASGKKLQYAHDLFHQNEYEQASYLYRDLLMQRSDYNEAGIGLAMSYYFMKHYEDASAVAAGIDHYAFKRILPEFLDACERAIKDLDLIEKNTARKEKLSPKEICIKA